ncbi:hypothetical protein RDABS01_003323 [Bienertia sinuspersici]
MYVFNFTTVNLPKLKLLCFTFHGGKSFDNIAMLIKSCPLLETLEMTLDSLLNSPRISIVSPKLKSLSLIMLNIIEKHQVIIDSPRLTYLYLVDSRALINFMTGPTELDSAYIDLTYLSFFRRRGMDANDFIREISKFVVQLRSVREFHLESNVKIFSYLHSINSLPLFRNLSSTTTTLTGSSGIIEILLFLHIAPKLKEVYVTLNHKEGNPFTNTTQLVVGALELLLNNLKCVNIIKDENARVGKEFKFCKACFRLSTLLSMTRVVFSGQYLTATNDTITSRNEIAELTVVDCRAVRRFESRAMLNVERLDSLNALGSYKYTSCQANHRPV